MTTKHTTNIAALIPADQAEAVHTAILEHASPAGDRFFAVEATHTDVDGREWVYVDTPARPGMVALFEALRPAFPDCTFLVIGELRQNVAEDVPVLWRAGSVAMVELVSRDEVLAGMAPIEVEVE